MTYYQQKLTEIQKTAYSAAAFRQVILAKHYIDTHFSDKIALHQIAASAFISKYHFLRLFKTVYGTTPHQYLKLVRVEAAKKLLYEKRSVCDVALSVGFDSSTSFSGLFKEITGVSPSVYTKRLNVRETPMALFRHHIPILAKEQF